MFRSTYFRIICSFAIFSMLTVWTHLLSQDRTSTALTDIRDIRIQNKTRSKTRLLITTYLRSGSTFTGEILAASSDVFYVFEPLWVLYEKWKSTNLQLLYLQRKPEFSNSSTIDDILIQTIEDIWNCSFEKLNLFTLTQSHLQHSKTTQPYYTCLKDNPGVNGVHKCLPVLRSACESRSVSLQKVVRLPLHLVQPLMNKYLDLKVIHLIRDPRASILSQYMYLHYFKWEDLSAYSKSFCNRIDQDLTVAKTLAKQYPNRFKIIRYETIAEYSMTSTEELYKFAGLDLTHNIRHFVNSITNADQPSYFGCLTCVFRTNSVIAANEWRRAIGFYAARDIDKQCSYLYHKMGYVPIRSIPHLKNTSIPLTRLATFAGMTI